MAAFDDILKWLGTGHDDSISSKSNKQKVLDYEYAKARYSEYAAARQDHLKDALEISDRFDKAILALSGGSLGLSLTFLEKFAPHPISWTLLILFGAWILLLASILSGVLALFSVQGAIQVELKNIENDYRAFLMAYEKGQLSEPPAARQANEKTRDVRKYNRFSIYTLGFGLLGLCVFSIINLFSTSLVPREQVMAMHLPYSVSATPSVPASPLQQAKTNVMSK